jgi:hypothetical protein
VQITREAGWVYGTKVTDKGGKAYGGFQWPAEPGPVTCPDWNPKPVCGGGLHFWEDGTGDLGAATIRNDSQWRLVRAREADVVRLDGKVKASAVEVLVIGERYDVCRLMSELAPAKQVHYGTATAGNYGTATAGYKGTATAGYKGIATAGKGGTATAGYKGTATAGEGGTATAGDGGTATAGNYGTATAGEGGTATAGDGGTATAGNYGTATAGEGGIVQIRWWDGTRWRLVVGYVGEGEIEPAIAYKLTEQGEFVRA